MRRGGRATYRAIDEGHVAEQLHALVLKPRHLAAGRVLLGGPVRAVFTHPTPQTKHISVVSFRQVSRTISIL